jgi:hypothetical protein
MKKIGLAIILLIGLYLVFGNKTSENELLVEEDTTEEIVSDTLSDLELEASRLRGGNFVKGVISNGTRLDITYTGDLMEYKKLINPRSQMTQTDLEEYWETNHAIEKMLVDSPVRMMKKFDFIDTVSITFPYKGIVYSTIVDKNGLEDFIDLDFSTVKEDWTNSFVDPYVYDPVGRELFLRRFGYIK